MSLNREKFQIKIFILVLAFYFIRLNVVLGFLVWFFKFIVDVIA